MRGLESQIERLRSLARIRAEHQHHHFLSYCTGKVTTPGEVQSYNSCAHIEETMKSAGAAQKVENIVVCQCQPEWESRTATNTLALPVIEGAHDSTVIGRRDYEF